MARRRKSHDTKARLLEVGITTMSRHGYAGAGLSQMLNTAGVPKGSFYNFFSSKENFAACALDTYMSIILGLIETQRQQAIPAIDQLISVHQLLIQFIRQHDYKSGCLLGVFAAELGDQAPKLHGRMLAHKKAWLDHYVEILAEAQGQRDIRRDLPSEILAQLVWTQWQGGLLQMQVDGSVDRLDTCLTAMIDLLRPRAPNGTVTDGL